MSRIFMTTGLFLFLLVGCSKGPPKTVAVSGTVTVDGKPSPGTVVQFWPTVKFADEERRFHSGQATTDDAGKFRFGAEGLVPGKYKVTYSRVLDRQGKPAPMAKPTEVGGRETVPEELRDPEKTTQVVEVSSEATPLKLALPK